MENIKNIQWFPGHMTKSLRMIEENIKLVDVVIYVLDARIPYSSFNPKFNKIVENKKVVYVLNKSDLAFDGYTKEWLKYLNNENSFALSLNAINGSSSKLVINAIKTILQEKIENDLKKGVKKTLRALVIGVPNSGKSTLINTLAGSKRAITGDRAGVTKTKQWVRLANGIDLLDTPGTLWPAFENQQIGINLALVGSIKDEILDINEIVLSFIETAKIKFKKNLEERYNIVVEGSNLEILEAIGRKRGCLVKGGEIDYDKASMIILEDFRKGKLGRITLEKPGENN